MIRPVASAALLSAVTAAALTACTTRPSIRVFARYSAQDGCFLREEGRTVTVAELVERLRTSPELGGVVIAAIENVPQACTAGAAAELRRLGIRTHLEPYQLPRLTPRP